MSQSTVSGIVNLTLQQFLDRYTDPTPRIKLIEWGPGTAAGQFVTVEDTRGRRAFYLLTNVTGSTNLAATANVRVRNNLDNTSIGTVTGTGSLGSATSRFGVAAELWIQDGVTNTGNPVTSTRPIPTTFTPQAIDGINDAYTQTAVNNAAVQLLASGTLYQDLKLKNIGANTCYLGFDNLVGVGTGYALAANLAAESEIIFTNFNANLWSISNVAGTTVSIIARG